MHTWRIPQGSGPEQGQYKNSWVIARMRKRMHSGIRYYFNAVCVLTYVQYVVRTEHVLTVCVLPNK